MWRRLIFTGVVVLGLLSVAWLVMHPLTPSAALSSTVVISAVYYNTYLPNQPEESFRLMNVSATPISLTNWLVTDGEGTIMLTGVINPGE